LWDLEAGQALRDYPGHDDIATHIAFSPDGTIALTSGFDGVVRIWQVHRTLAELIDWVQANRYVRVLTCQERDFYQALPLCPP
jgi:WD40 repeat protein